MEKAPSLTKAEAIYSCSVEKLRELRDRLAGKGMTVQIIHPDGTLEDFDENSGQGSSRK